MRIKVGDIIGYNTENYSLSDQIKLSHIRHRVLRVDYYEHNNNIHSICIIGDDDEDIVGKEYDWDISIVKVYISRTNKHLPKWMLEK